MELRRPYSLRLVASSQESAMTAATMPSGIDWPWPKQIAAGHFQDRLHRVRPGTRNVRLDGVTYYLADCGAIAVPTDETPEGWEFCTSCWPCGRPADPAPAAQPPAEPTGLPACLDWGSAFRASSAHQPEPPLFSMSLTTALATSTSTGREGGIPEPHDHP
jgi:hypothetical protein